MKPFRQLTQIGRLVLLWFALSLGVAVASPLVNPQPMELVCSSAGAIKVVVKTDDGARNRAKRAIHVAGTQLAGAPPPSADAPQFTHPLPLGHALQPIPAARLAAATAAPLPARGPPALA